MAYKRYIKVSKGNINNVKDLVAKYNKMFNKYSAELQRLYVDWNEDNSRFDVVVPEIAIINCDYAYEKHRDKSIIGIDQDGRLEMNIKFPNWATTEEELDDIQRGIQRVYSAKMMYLDFLNEFMMFDEEKYPSTRDTVFDSHKIKDSTGLNFEIIYEMNDDQFADFVDEIITIFEWYYGEDMPDVVNDLFTPMMITRDDMVNVLGALGYKELDKILSAYGANNSYDSIIDELFL